MEREAGTEVEGPCPCVRADVPSLRQGWLEAALYIAADRGIEYGLKKRQYIRPVRAVVWVLERGLALQDDNWASGIGQSMQSRQLAIPTI